MDGSQRLEVLKVLKNNDALSTSVTQILRFNANKPFSSVQRAYGCADLIKAFNDENPYQAEEIATVELLLIGTQHKLFGTHLNLADACKIVVAIAGAGSATEIREINGKKIQGSKGVLDGLEILPQVQSQKYKGEQIAYLFIDLNMNKKSNSFDNYQKSQAGR